MELRVKYLLTISDDATKKYVAYRKEMFATHEHDKGPTTSRYQYPTNMKSKLSTLSGPIIDRMPNNKAIFGNIKYWQVCVVSRNVNWNSHFEGGNFYQIYLPHETVLYSKEFAFLIAYSE